MPLLSATNLAKSFGAVDIFSGISLSVPHRARMAVVGPNGVGKTTLLRILVGEETPSAGQVSRARGLRIGYLPQEAAYQSDETLWNECLGAFDHLRLMETELAQLEAQMSDPRQAESALSRYGALQTRFDNLGGYTYVNRIQQVLTGLGFTPDELEFPLKQLSGGQRTRALLARLLLSSPDLLVLDEPTNHLDIQAVEWLENYLSQWEGGVLLVSHDRYFMDKVANTILEMSPHGVELYRGNYSAYLEQRQHRWEERMRLFESEKERIEKDFDFIKRNISGGNVAQARGRLRRLGRYLEAVEQLGMQAVTSRNWGEVAEEVEISSSLMSVEEAWQRIKSLKSPVHRPPALHMKLKPEFRSGEIVLRARGLVIGYPNKVLFKVDDLELRRLECAALIGPNGAGKTTFLKTILERIPPLAGEVTLGASLNVGYFAQAHEELHPERTLVQEIESVAPRMLLAEIRDYLARFLFTDEDVFKPVSVLSGGERGRLALAKLALSQANLLLLDEPTNHLDIPSQETLQAVLAEYQGTILLVSHDRYLIDALATQVWEIDEAAGILHVYQGTYSQYRQYQESQRELKRQLEEIQRQPTPPAAQRTAPRSSSVERRRQARLQEVEAQIAELEAQLGVISRFLENPPPDPLKVREMGSEFLRLQNALDSLMQEWESLHNQ